MRNNYAPFRARHFRALYWSLFHPYFPLPPLIATQVVKSEESPRGVLKQFRSVAAATIVLGAYGRYDAFRRGEPGNHCHCLRAVALWCKHNFPLLLDAGELPNLWKRFFPSSPRVTTYRPIFASIEIVG